MQCGVTRRQEEGEIKRAKDIKDRGNEDRGFGGRRRIPRWGSEMESEDSRGGREGDREGEEDVERDISLPARGKIISPGLARRNVQAD